MAPRVLCNLIEVSDASWIAAAEGLLGRDREAVFVDRSDIGRATALFKEGRREFRGASLVSLNKLDPSKASPQPCTFPSLFKSEDADALAFIARRHGSVRLADTIVQFNEPGRAIMRDGLYDDGLVRTHRAADPSTFKIGKDAQARALLDMAEKAEQLVESAAKSDCRCEIGGFRLMCSFVASSTISFRRSRPLPKITPSRSREKNEVELRIASLDGEGRWRLTKQASSPARSST